MLSAAFRGTGYTPNLNHPLNIGRLSWWLVLPQNYGGGKWMDLIGQNHVYPVGFNSSAGWQGTSRKGGRGQITLNGSSYLSSTIATLSETDGPKDKAVSCWINPSSLAQYGLVDRDYDNGSPNDGGWGFWMQSNGKPWWWVEGGLDLRDDGSRSATIGNWTHLGVSWDSTTKTASFYVNGELNSQLSNTSIIERDDTVYPFCIGAMRGSGFVYNGFIDDVSVWKRQLTSQEFFTLYQQSLTGYPDLLQATGLRFYSQLSIVSSVAQTLASSTAAGNAASISSFTIVISGNSTASFVSLSLNQTMGTTLGSSTASAQAKVIFVSVGNVAADSNSTVVAASIGIATGNAIGSSLINFQCSSFSLAAINLLGTSNAIAITLVLTKSIANAIGNSTSLFQSASIAIAIGTSFCTANGLSVFSGEANAIATSNSTIYSIGIDVAAFACDGASNALFVGNSLVHSTGNVGAVSFSNALGKSLSLSTYTVLGDSTVSVFDRLIALSEMYAVGDSYATAIGLFGNKGNIIADSVAAAIGNSTSFSLGNGLATAAATGTGSAVIISAFAASALSTTLGAGSTATKAIAIGYGESSATVNSSVKVIVAATAVASSSVFGTSLTVRDAEFYLIATSLAVVVATCTIEVQITAVGSSSSAGVGDKTVVPVTIVTADSIVESVFMNPPSVVLKNSAIAIVQKSYTGSVAAYNKQLYYQTNNYRSRNKKSVAYLPAITVASLGAQILPEVERIQEKY